MRKHSSFVLLITLTIGTCVNAEITYNEKTYFLSSYIEWKVIVPLSVRVRTGLAPSKLLLPEGLTSLSFSYGKYLDQKEAIKDERNTCFKRHTWTGCMWFITMTLRELNCTAGFWRSFGRSKLNSR